MNGRVVTKAFFLIALAVLIYFLSGCKGVTTLEEASACGRGPECDELWKAYNKREERMEERRRENARAEACRQQGGVMLKRGANYDYECSRIDW